ncbi:MAG: hypothetical protein WAM26_20060, partial [Nitrososphaeraceae archaeon]
FNLRPDSKIKIGIITNNIISGSPSMKLYNSSTSKPIIGAAASIAPRNIRKVTPGMIKFLVYRRTAEMITNRRLRLSMKVTSSSPSATKYVFWALI